MTSEPAGASGGLRRPRDEHGARVVKRIAGIVGNANALVADAVESSADIFVDDRLDRLEHCLEARDDNHPFGSWQARAIAAAIDHSCCWVQRLDRPSSPCARFVTPHQAPAPFTLFVGRCDPRQGNALPTGRARRKRDRKHRRRRGRVASPRDAISSGSAFVGIAIALIGGPGWEAADDWAALLAAFLITVNGARTLRPAVSGLRDEAPDRSCGYGARRCRAWEE